ncbi:MAG: endonuclease/exonuclease/phosphatase family protein [Actinomycetota bacterium]|jgi:endonuclease/exonuclease/phosphatase family metal-dependent hydrolase
MRVMTWNLWWRFGPWEQRAAAIEAVVSDVQPDVLLLQEVWGIGTDSAAHRLADRLGFHVSLSDDSFVGERREAGVGFHNAIVSRWPQRSVQSHALPGADGTAGHRRVLTAVLDRGSGQWPVVSTHLDHRFDDSALRQLQCAHVLAIIDGLRGAADTEPPVVIGGDFNAVPDSDEVRMLTGRRAAPVAGLVLSDCWEHVGEGPGFTWRADNPYQSVTAWPDRRLDYVFVSWPRPKPLGTAVSARLAGVEPVDGVYASDHAAVVVDLISS